MNTGKIYFDSDGNQRTIYQMVRCEPAWAATRIQEGENAIEALRDWLSCADTPEEWARCRDQAKRALRIDNQATAPDAEKSTSKAVNQPRVSGALCCFAGGR